MRNTVTLFWDFDDRRWYVDRLPGLSGEQFNQLCDRGLIPGQEDD